MGAQCWLYSPTGMPINWALDWGGATDCINIRKAVLSAMWPPIRTGPSGGSASPDKTTINLAE